MQNICGDIISTMAANCLKTIRPVLSVLIGAGVVLCQQAPDRDIAVRVTNGVAEFYSVSSGRKFTPRGNNYIKVAGFTKPSGEATSTHSTFAVGRYDPDSVEL